MTTLGIADAVSEYGADATGGSDASREINHALETSPMVAIPAGAVCACNAPIVVGETRTLLVLGTLIRRSALSRSTRPVVILNGDYASVKGFGRAGVIKSENDSPDGVVLWGVESPLDRAPRTAIRWGNVQDLMVFGNGDAAASRGLVCQSMQAHGTGALYDAHFHNIQVYNVGDGVYCNSDANGNTFDKINFYDIGRYAVHVDGASENRGAQHFLASDNNFFDMFVDHCPGSFQAVIRARSCTHTNFIGVHGEPGAGVYCDIDASCSRITLVSSMNVGRTGQFAAPLSTFIVNGVAGVGQYVGQMYTEWGLAEGVPSGVATRLFTVPSVGEFYEITAFARGRGGGAATCVAVRGAGGDVSLLNNASTAAAFALGASGPAVTILQRAGAPLTVEWRARIMSAYV